MKYQTSKYATELMELRILPESLINKIIKHPQQIVEQGDMKVYQSIIAIEGKKRFLYRIFVDTSTKPVQIITAYKTSKIDKYWIPNSEKHKKKPL